jgi:hypothetical protein
MAWILSDITGRHPAFAKGINDLISPVIRVDTTYDNSLADAEPAGQLMHMDGKVQRGSSQCLGSVFEDIEQYFPDSNENYRFC